jgi:hypothetical protein
MENSTTAARTYKEPLHASHVQILRDLVMSGRRTMCPGCEACDAAGAAATFAFQDIARLVTYYERDGNLSAREMFNSMAPAHRNFASMDLNGLRDRCAFRTDYPEIMKRAQRYFA